MATQIRIARLEGVILKRLGRALQSEVNDPRLAFVTVTRAKLARDLSVCDVGWSVIGSDGDTSKVAHLLDHARGYLQGLVASELTCRQTPRLRFHHDDTLVRAAHLEQLINESVAQDRADHPDLVGEEE